MSIDLSDTLTATYGETDVRTLRDGRALVPWVGNASFEAAISVPDEANASLIALCRSRKVCVPTDHDAPGYFAEDR